MFVTLSCVAAAEDRHIPVDLMIFLVFMVAALTPAPAANAAPNLRFVPTRVVHRLRDGSEVVYVLCALPLPQ